MTQYLPRARAFVTGLNPSPVSGRTYDIYDPTPPPGPGGSWDTRKMRPLPEDGVAGDFLYGEFSTWAGPTSPHIFVATDGDPNASGATRALATTMDSAMDRIAALPTNAGDRYVIMRGGIYWLPQLNWTLAGLPTSQIWLASDPGEIARLAFCIQVFHDDPAAAWQPGGVVADEYISSAAHATVGGSPALGGGTAWIAASMTPLQNVDQASLEAATEIAPLGPKDSDYYGGPGCRKDASHFMHVRLTPTNLDFLTTCDRLNFGGDYNWKGEQDAQQLPMFVTVKATNMNVRLADYTGLKDMVTIGGGGDETIRLQGKNGVQLDNWWSYPAHTGIRADNCTDTILTNCKMRGQAAPWTSRAWMKYHGATGYCANFNVCPGTIVTRCWAQDAHEGVRFDGNSPGGAPAGSYEFSRNIIENCNDDGLYMPGKETSGIKDIYLNWFRAINQSLPTTGQGTGQVEESPETGVYIHHNFIDRRWGVQGGPPRTALTDMDLYYAGSVDPDRAGELFMTHGGVNYERMHIRFYHNTVLSTSPGGSEYYRGLGNTSNYSITDVHNNILEIIFGNVREDLDLLVGAVVNRSHNIAWSLEAPTSGSIPNEIYADPQFSNVTADRFNAAEDIRLTNTSPARGAGRTLEANYRQVDFSAVMTPGVTVNPRDIGAIPYGVALEPRRIFGPWSEV